MLFRIAFRIVSLLCLMVNAADAQIHLHWGVEAGVPMTDRLSSYSVSSTSGQDYTLSRYNSVTKRLLIGPCLRLDLAKGLGLEFDAIYQRVNFDYVSIASLSSFAYLSTSFEQIHANRWQFPLLVQYNRTIRKRDFFVEVGPSISTFVNAKGTFSSSLTEPPIVPTSNSGPISGQGGTLAGITAGAGMNIPVFHKHVRPEFRYSRWFSTNSAVAGSSFILATGNFSSFVSVPSVVGSSGFRVNSNEVSFLLGFTF